MDPTNAQTATHFAEQLTGLPWSIHGLTLLLLATGVALWLWGAKLLKPLTIGVFVIVGMLAGFLIVPVQASPTNVGGGGLLVGTGLGAVFGLIAGLIVYRSAMAVGMGVVLAAAGPIVASVVMQELDRGRAEYAETAPADTGVDGETSDEWIGLASPADGFTSEPPLSGDELLLDGVGMGGPLDARTLAMADVQALRMRISEMNAVLEQKAIEAAQSETAVRVRSFVRSFVEELGAWWRSLPSGQRFVYGASMLGGLAVGVLVGLSLPMRSAGVVTAMAGAGITIVALALFLASTGLPGGQRLGDLTPRAWLGAWVVAAIVGVLFQWGQQKPGAKAEAA